MFSVALLIIVAYLIGSIPFGVIVGRLRGFDPRAVGSGNIGMTNVARAGGISAAAATFVGDVIKGALPVAFARWAGFDLTIVGATALAAFVGSICSVFLRFSGGKGVSAALGVWLVLAPWAVGGALIAFIAMAAAFRIVSLASISAAVVLPIMVAILGLPNILLLLSVIISALVVLRLHENIGRLLRGEEPRFRPKSSASAG